MWGQFVGTMSGGQKQHITLAWAADSQANLYMLDLPLSAIDMHTCQLIFNHCIQDMMVRSGGHSSVGHTPGRVGFNVGSPSDHGRWQDCVQMTSTPAVESSICFQAFKVKGLIFAIRRQDAEANPAEVVPYWFCPKSAQVHQRSFLKH
jgi:hypothetical protein